MNNNSVYLLLISFFLIISCTEDDQPQEQPSPDFISITDIQFETKLVSLGIDSDGLVNQQLLKEDAENVSSLDLSSQNVNDEIIDLTGIEAFVNLKHLYASGNAITTVDLSANTLLDSLNLAGNSLSTIDVSHNIQLVWLDLKVNDITAITGLSAATRLNWLSLSFNLLEEFSVHNESLVNLLISDNLLTSFDASGAVNLESILLRTNLLPEIDLSSNAQLKVLVLSNNKLQDLNLEGNSHLQYLYSSSNLLTNLDVSNLQELIDLRIDRNPNLPCIKIATGQVIPTVSVSDYQELNTLCN